MKSYLTIEAYPKVKRKLVLLYFLNVTDIIFTLLFHNTGYFIELNPVMKQMLSNQTVILIAKLIIPFALLFYIGIRLKKATGKQLKIANILILVVLIFYLVINLMHLVTLFTLQFYQLI